MADGVISDLAKKVLGTLGKAAVKEAATWWRARDDLEKLKHRMAFIEARVRDAENRQEGENGELIKLWLRDLKVVLYRADDLFDLVLTVDRKNRKVESRMMAKVGVLFLKPFISAKDSGIFAHKIKSINDELEVIKSNMNDFNFIPNLALVGLSLQMQQLISRRQRETKSFVKAEDVIGRDNDKKTIVRMLFDPKYDEKRIAVFSILGYGGLGKTTLAQFVYNDETVRNRFDLTKWVCVPEVDDRNTVMRRVYHSLTGDKDFNKASYDDIILGIRGTIKGKKYLLVLDDIWDETRDNWLDLISILEDGANGSRVIITARTANAANAFGVTESHNLGLLTPDESWELFKKLAFKSKQEESNSILTQLGGEIVESCGNVPLAIRVVGCLLYPDNSEQHWRAIRDARLSKAKVQEVEDMMQVLKLSYDYLSPALKQCFAYCALFPTDYRYSKDRLVKMWMAQGYVDPSRVDIGEKYFMGLLGRSLFQDPEEDDEGNVTYCKMHDLVHLLAQNIASEEIVHDYPQDIASEKIGQLVESSNQVVLGNRLLHASFQVMKRKKGDEWEAPKSLLKARLMRSLILFSYNHNCDVKASSLKMMLLKFKSLRVLDLEGMNISTVPNSIGKLRHLRYLNLAWNNIKCLPDDVTRLQNLQTLILECCSGLTELPRDFCKLDSLRHLGLVGSGLRDLPTGFEKLTSLEKLDLFIVGKYGDLHSLPALKLMGNLVIKFCSYSTSWAAQRAGLKNSLQLTRLTLLFEYERKYFAADMYEMIECLEMPPNLKYFVVEGYEGYKMPPKWLYGLSKLLVIRITSCENCRDLPRFSQLRHLKRLYLTSLGALKYVEEGGECSSRSRDAYFRSLEVLELQDLRDVEGWTRPTEDEPRQLLFPCLLHMKIVKCPKLMSMPLAPKLESLSADTFNWKVFESNLTTMEASSSSSSTTLFTSLKVLDISTIEDGPASLTISSRFSSLQKIDIASCKELTSLVIESSNSIRHLGISWCKSLENISLGNLSLLHALKIVECPKMAVLPQSLLGLPSLHTVYIRKCPALITRYNKRNGQDRRLLQHIPDADIL